MAAHYTWSTSSYKTQTGAYNVEIHFSKVSIVSKNDCIPKPYFGSKVDSEPTMNEVLLCSLVY